jgi:HAD superfamily hydrolase (TIGR01549 family)
MIKAVLLDWFTTLSKFEPSREKLYCNAFAELGIVVPEDKAARGVLLGDEYLYTENMKTPLAQLPAEVRDEMYLCFPRMIAEEAKIKVAPHIHQEVREKIRKSFGGATYVLFDDVIPTVKSLSEKGLTLGLVTNLREDIKRESINALCRRLGLEPYLKFAITSEQVGFAKPDRRIFQAALEKAGVKADEAIFVGDQYRIDVVGARNAGIQPILIDRCDLYPDVTDCPRIRTLPEVEKYVR